MKLIPLTIALALSVVAGSVAAQDPDLKSLDENSDDKISVAEFQAYAESRLPGFEQLKLFAKKVDANADGEISADEFSNRMEILEKIRSGESDDMDADNQPDSKKPKPDKKPTTVPASKDKSGVNDAFTKMKTLIKKNDWQAAAKLMTTEAADRTATELVTKGLGMCQIELPMPMPQLEDAIDDMDSVLTKYGLDKLGIKTKPMVKIELGTHDEDEEESESAEPDEKQVEANRKKNSDKIIEALDKDGKRWQIVGELWEAIASSPLGMNPLVSKAEKITVDGDKAVLEVKHVPSDVDNDQPGVMIQIMAPPMFLNFQKSNGDWKYTGLNEKKIKEAMKEFQENMPGSDIDEGEIQR